MSNPVMGMVGVGSGPASTSSPVQSAPAPAPSGVTPAAPQVTLFVCTNSARPGLDPTSGVRERPLSAPLAWPPGVREISVPCAGAIQPEHLLKAFEAGEDLVGVVACDPDNCHYLEGCKRALRRAECVRVLLDEMGLGGERMRVFHLPGSAAEDLAIGSGAAQEPRASPPADCAAAGGTPAAPREAEVARRVKAIIAELASQFQALGASPLRPHQRIDGLRE